MGLIAEFGLMVFFIGLGIGCAKSGLTLVNHVTIKSIEVGEEELKKVKKAIKKK